jgi:hypothetical protein
MGREDISGGERGLRRVGEDMLEGERDMFRREMEMR